MPVFNTTLMGLLGLSAGTYLGLKIPEATTPAKAAAQSQQPPQQPQKPPGQ